MLERILYVSAIAPGVGEAAIQRIVAAAAIRNRRLDVTGLLAHCETHFVQVLEGRHEALDELMRSIEHDPRHREMRVVVREPIATRRFAHWDMGVLDGASLAEELDAIHRAARAPEDLVERLRQQAELLRL